MSLTAVLSAATSVADPGDGGHERKWADQTRKQRDLYTQFVISSALGLVAFFSFCVCVSKFNCSFFLLCVVAYRYRRFSDGNGQRCTPHADDYVARHLSCQSYLTPF